MTDNQIEGAAQTVVGRVEDAVGGLTGDAATQIKGKARQVSGNIQETYGDAVERVREFTVAQPLVALSIAIGVGFVLGRRTVW